MVGIATVRVILAARGSASASSTTAKAPASATAWASSSMEAHWSWERPWVLNPPSALIAWGVSPMWAITGIPRSVRNRMVSPMRRPPSSLMAPHWVSFITCAALWNAWIGLSS
jgi:hypothetical protein